jgi:hypothetical protein
MKLHLMEMVILWLEALLVKEFILTYEKSNVKVTDLKISSFSEGIPFYFPPSTYHAYNTSQIEMTEFFWKTQLRT